MNMTANEQARWKSSIRNNHPPRRTLRERIWLRAYHRALVDRGLGLTEALGMDPDVDLTYSPDDAADDELYYMAQDAL